MERRGTSKFIPVCQSQMGRVIGRNGCKIKEIRQQTGTNIKKADGGFNIYGNEDQIEKAESMIQSIVNSYESLHVQVPKCAIGHVIGKQGDRLNSVMEETGTKIIMEQGGHFYIKGDEDKRCKARLMIKDIACNAVNNYAGGELPHCKSFSFIDGKSVDMETDFELQKHEHYKHEPVWTVKNMYKLAPLEEITVPAQAQGTDRYLILKTNVLEVLQRLHEHRDNYIVDIWCLFGHAYITDVDEVEEGEVYQLTEVQKRLSDKDNPWLSIFFKREINLRELHETLEKTDLEKTNKVNYIRCAFSILTPSCRNIRIKVFLKSDENNILSFYKHSPESVKGVIESIHSDDNGPSYFLCKPPQKHMKATIFCPFDKLDCYLMIRTKMKTAQATSKEEEDENQVIIEFLNKNLVISDGELQLLDKTCLPEAYDVYYWRQSRRTMFQYSSQKLNFTIKITEEYSESNSESGSKQEVECVNDVQIRRNEWNKGFSSGDWKPHEIVQDLPTFLSLVNDVHKNIFFQESEEN